MASKSQYVTIPLEEYKELLLKGAPATETDHLIVGRIIELLPAYLKYKDDVSSWDVHIDHLQSAGNGSEFIKEVLRIFKYSDFETYMKLWNQLASEERNRQIIEGRIAQMKAAKELRDDQVFREED